MAAEVVFRVRDVIKYDVTVADQRLPRLSVTSRRSWRVSRSATVWMNSNFELRLSDRPGRTGVRRSRGRGPTKLAASDGGIQKTTGAPSVAWGAIPVRGSLLSPQQPAPAAPSQVRPLVCIPYLLMAETP